MASNNRLFSVADMTPTLSMSAFSQGGQSLRGFTVIALPGWSAGQRSREAALGPCSLCWGTKEKPQAFQLPARLRPYITGPNCLLYKAFAGKIV